MERDQFLCSYISVPPQPWYPSKQKYWPSLSLLANATALEQSRTWGYHCVLVGQTCEWDYRSRLRVSKRCQWHSRGRGCFSSGKRKQSSFFLLFLGGCISAIERPVREEVHRNRSTLNNPNCPVDSQWERGLSVAMTRSARWLTAWTTNEHCKDL